MTSSLSPIAAQRARNARMQAEAEAIASQHSGRVIPELLADTPVVLMPANTRELVPLPDAERAEFLANLRVQMDAAFALPLRDNLAPMSEKEVSERADAGELMSRDPALPAEMVLGGCSTCRGDCCTAGGTHAFLRAESLVRVRAQQAQLGEIADSMDAMTALYVAALPETHYEKSCVYHARFGCTLTRQLRSNLCNRYQCGELTQLSRALDAAGSSRAYVGAADSHHLLRMALIDGDVVALSIGSVADD